MSGRQPLYDQFETSVLFCARCRLAQPVRKRLLLVLQPGNKYDYACTLCASPVGPKMDDDTESFSVL